MGTRIRYCSVFLPAVLLFTMLQCTRSASGDREAAAAALFAAGQAPLCSDAGVNSAMNAFGASNLEGTAYAIAPSQVGSTVNADALRALDDGSPIVAQTVVAAPGQIIENRVFSNPDGVCLRVQAAEGVIIRNNYFKDCKQAMELVAEAGRPLNDVVIRDNLLERMRSGIILRWSGPTENYVPNARNVVIHNNRIMNVLEPAAGERHGGKPRRPY